MRSRDHVFACIVDQANLRTHSDNQTPLATPDGQETIKNSARVKQNAGFDTFYDLRDPGISAVQFKVFAAPLA